MLAVYHTPEKMIPADKAFVVLGSTAAGTMSPVSKIVFDDKAKAAEFAEHCGGDVVDFQGALAAAKSSVLKENTMVKARQLKKGKIVEPSETDRCPVCNMFSGPLPLWQMSDTTKKWENVPLLLDPVFIRLFGKTVPICGYAGGTFFNLGGGSQFRYVDQWPNRILCDRIVKGIRPHGV